jgi:hypothetical protein
MHQHVRPCCRCIFVSIQVRSPTAVPCVNTELVTTTLCVDIPCGTLDSDHTVVHTVITLQSRAIHTRITCVVSTQACRDCSAAHNVHSELSVRRDSCNTCLITRMVLFHQHRPKVLNSCYVFNGEKKRVVIFTSSGLDVIGQLLMVGCHRTHIEPVGSNSHHRFSSIAAMYDIILPVASQSPQCPFSQVITVPISVCVCFVSSRLGYELFSYVCNINCRTWDLSVYGKLVWDFTFFSFSFLPYKFR